MDIKDNVKVYIRHCEERTVPILEWFFRDFEMEAINGFNRKFADVLETMFLKIRDQDQRFALVLDGDLIPIVSIDEIVRLFIEPLHEGKNIICLNGSMVGKFFSMDRAMIGGIKSYKKNKIKRYLKNIDKKQLRTESFLYTKVGCCIHLKTRRPQVGHEYGQFLWHIYEKAFQRGAKATKEIQMRERNEIDFLLYKKAYRAGKELKNSYEPTLYRKDNLPLEYSEHEKDSIMVNDIEKEYLRLKEEIDRDTKEDVGDVLNRPTKVGLKRVRGALLRK